MFDYCLADGATVVESWFITEIQKYYHYSRRQEIVVLFSKNTKICGLQYIIQQKNIVFDKN